MKQRKIKRYSLIALVICVISVVIAIQIHMTRKLIRSDWRLVQVEKGGEVIVSDIEDECKAYYLFLRAFKFGISHKVGYSLYVFNNLYLHSYCDLLKKNTMKIKWFKKSAIQSENL